MAIVRYRDENGNIVPLVAIKGDDGDQMYVRFSAYADGTDMSEKWDSERNYMGIAFARVAPSNKEAYQWIALADISLGRYAEEGSAERYLFFVGNGTDEDNRSNALTVDENGNAWFAGELTFGSDSYSPREEIEAEKVARAEHVEQAVSEAKEWIRPVSAGGTGGTTAEDARDNLGINRELFNVPEWNVEENVGAISPAVSFEAKITSNDQTDIDELKRCTWSTDKAFSFPIINTGRVCLDFVISGNKHAITYLDGSPLTAHGSVEVYVGEDQVFKREVSESIYNTTKTVPCSIEFDVVKGEDVALVVRQTVGLHKTTYGDSSYLVITLKDIQLKANIATAHTYPFSLGVGLEKPTSDEILETLLGV